MTCRESAKRLTLWMSSEAGELAFDQDGSVLQQGAHKAVRGQLTEQIHQELDEALAEQQQLGVCCGLLGGGPRVGSRLCSGDHR